MSDYTTCDWPTIAELKAVLDLDPDSSKWDDLGTLDRVLASAIQQVKDDIGAWDDMIDVPTCKQAQAALRMAELMSMRPDEASKIIPNRGRFTEDPTYLRLLQGSRRRFAIS